MMELIGDERLDYLLADEHMRIIQSKTVFAFSLDAVLLARFASIPIQRGNILDLCSGNGVIPMLLSKRSKAKITGVEIQERLYHMAQRSVQYNELQNQISFIHGDLKEMKDVLPQSTYDTVTCNPPYFKTPKETEHNLNEHLTIARHEVKCTLLDVIKACKRYVKPGGKVALVHRPERLVDILELCRSHHLEPKRMQLVYPKQNKEANILLVEAIRDGKPGLKLLPPLFIYEQDGTYTKEAEGIIYGN